MRLLPDTSQTRYRYDNLSRDSVYGVGLSDRNICILT
jgi:hypothetical protein